MDAWSGVFGAAFGASFGSAGAAAPAPAAASISMGTGGGVIRSWGLWRYFNLPQPKPHEEKPRRRPRRVRDDEYLLHRNRST